MAIAVSTGRILLERLRPEVLAVSRAGFRLRDDLERLARVTLIAAPDATVFYAARILEALAAMEVEALTGESPKTLNASLERLDGAGLLSPSRQLYFNTLRVLGNEARHIWRSLEPEDADLSLGLLERFLIWHFEDFRHGPRGTLTEGGSFVAIDPSFLEALRLLEDPVRHLQSLQQLWSVEDSVLRRIASFAAMYAEALIKVNRAAEALQIADQTLADAGAGVRGHKLQAWALVRLRQLRGLALRIVDRCDESARELEALKKETPDDEETLGILAGTYKVMWRDERRGSHERERRLRDAVQVYHHAFLKSEGTYSGINAATMSLLDGDQARATKIAGKIVDLYEARSSSLTAGAGIAFSGYFDRVTLAEALLLSGRLDDSRQLYRDAFDRHPELPYPIKKTREQMQMLLRQLGLGDDPDAFLAQKKEDP